MEHKLATVRLPFDFLAGYFLAIVFIAHFIFRISFEDLMLVENMDANLTAAIGMGIVEAVLGIFGQLAALTRLENEN